MLSTALVCLALNIYWESRSEYKEYGITPMAATAHVVLNRVKDNRYPNDICAVVKQSKTYRGNPIRNQCQFSWWCDGLSDQPMNKPAFEFSMLIARLVLTGRIEDVTNGATHYHAYYVQPKWNISKTFTARIGSHLFYRWEDS